MIGYWATKRGDTLVVALVLLVFWLPFHTTFSRLNVSPQEIATYGICLVAAVLDRRGVRHWVAELTSTIPIAARFVIVLFTLAVLQSLLRIAHPSVLGILGSLRSILLYPVLLALLIAYVIRTRKCEQVLVTSFFWGGVLLASYALLLPLWGVQIVNGAVAGRLGAESSFLSDYHPNNLSLYFAFAVVFAPSLVLGARQDAQRRNGRIWRVVSVMIGVAILLSALWLTYSRGALSGLVIASVMVLLFLIVFGTLRQRAASASVLLASALVLGGIILIKGVKVLGRYASLLNPAGLSNDPNVQGRVQLYDRALKIALDHPFTGIGLGQFAQGAAVPFSPHNTYLDLWVSIGLVGLLAFVAIILLGGSAVVRIAQLRKASTSGTTVNLSIMLSFSSALIIFLVQAFVETFDVQPRIAPALWMLALAPLAIWFRESQRKRSPRDLSGSAQRIASARDHLGSATDSSQAHAEPQVAAGRVNTNADSDATQSSYSKRAELVSATLPAVERPWNFDTGSFPIIENPYQAVTDFEIPAIGPSSALRGAPPQLRPIVSTPTGQATLDQALHPDEMPPRHSGAHDDLADRRSDSGEQEDRTAKAAETILQRAPTSYLWNQVYSLWFFAINFLLSIVITRGLSRDGYGAYAILSTIVSTLLFVFAFGLEDAATVFLPRVLSLHGQGEAGRLVRRFTVQRIVVMGVVGFLLAVGLPVVVPALERVGFLPAHFDQSVNGYLGLRPWFMGAALAGSSLVALQAAFFVAVMKSRTTLIVGGISQLMSVTFMILLLKLGFGVDSIFAVQAVVTWLTAIVYFFQLAPFLRARARTVVADAREMRKLMFTAWLTNVTNGALGKQMDIMLMSFFAVSFVAIGYYNLAYQLGSIVGVLLISGLGGVGMAAMSAALAAGGRDRLASMWSASLMLQIVLAVPLQIVCLVLADQVITVIFGAQYAGAAPLLRIYLVFSIIGRFIGGGSNQSALYVIGRQRSVLLARWGGLVINVLLDVVFIQVYGPAGALFGTGFSQLWVGIMEYLMLRAKVPVRYPSGFALRITFIAGLPAIVLLWWTPEGITGLVARCILFTLLALVGVLTFGLGDANDLTDMINANPKLRKLVTIVSNRLPAAMMRRGQPAELLD